MYVFFQAADGIRDGHVTGVQTCALPICADFDYLFKEMVSTPGVREVAPYRAISAVNISAGGSIVTVDFSTRVKDWHRLFTHLLPSHLLESGQFDRVLESAISASAGKFSVASKI